MDIHDSIVGTVLAKGFFYKCVERIALAAGRKWSGTAKHFIYESTSELFGIFSVIKKTVNIRATVIKYREQESQIWHFYDPVTDTVFDVVGFCVVAQAGFGKIDRTDAAEDMVIDFIGCIEHLLTIGRFSGNIVNGMNENDIVILTIIIIFDDLIIKFLKYSIILKFTATEFHEKFLGTTFFFLFKRKVHVDQIFSNCAG